jgi:hypothetical protein
MRNQAKPARVPLPIGVQLEQTQKKLEHQKSLAQLLFQTIETIYEMPEAQGRPKALIDKVFASMEKNPAP